MILLKSNPIVENIIKEITPKLNKLQKKRYNSNPSYNKNRDLL